MTACGNQNSLKTAMKLGRRYRIRTSSETQSEAPHLDVARVNRIPSSCNQCGKKKKQELADKSSTEKPELPRSVHDHEHHPHPTHQSLHHHASHLQMSNKNHHQIGEDTGERQPMDRQQSVMARHKTVNAYNDNGKNLRGKFHQKRPVQKVSSCDLILNAVNKKIHKVLCHSSSTLAPHICNCVNQSDGGEQKVRSRSGSSQGSRAASVKKSRRFFVEDDEGEDDDCPAIITYQRPENTNFTPREPRSFRPKAAKELKPPYPHLNPINGLPLQPKDYSEMGRRIWQTLFEATEPQFVDDCTLPATSPFHAVNDPEESTAKRSRRVSFRKSVCRLILDEKGGPEKPVAASVPTQVSPENLSGKFIRMKMGNHFKMVPVPPMLDDGEKDEVQVLVRCGNYVVWRKYKTFDL